MRVSFHTLGCKLNFAETGALEREFARRSFEVVPFGEAAEVTVLNSCTVTDQAEGKCRSAIRRALRASPDAFVIVTGCYAQLRPEAIARIPGVDAVLGAAEKFRLFDLLESFDKGPAPSVHVSCTDGVPAFNHAVSAERTRAFLKVQDGCDYRCSFCTIPMARGPSRSAEIPRLVEEARRVAREGYREIVLTGVNIGLFGLEHGASLIGLLRALEEVEDVARYRISSIEPNLLTDEIIDHVASSPRFLPHFHLPLQSGDDEVLGRMRRRYRRAHYADRVHRIREAIPDAAVGADVIVGFPGEDEVRFENGFRFLADLPLSYLHVFTYSERPGTAAVEQGHGRPVPPEARARRSRRLRLLSEQKRLAFCAAHAGRVRPVLWEIEEKNGRMFGLTDNYIRVHAPYDASRTNRIEPVRLGAVTAEGVAEG